MTDRRADERQGSIPVVARAMAAGTEALAAGQRQRARRLFGQIVRQDPRNAMAWLWLSRSVDDETQKRDCLERVRWLEQSGQSTTEDLAAKTPRVQRKNRFSAAACGRAGWQKATGVSGHGVGDHKGTPMRVVVGVIALVLVCAATPLLRWQPARAQGTLEASGAIWAEQVAIASEVGGLVVSLPVAHGEAVAAGDVLVQLDTTLLDAQIETAQAAVALADAGLKQAQAGTRPSQIAVAQAQLAQAEAARIAAGQVVSDTMLLVQNPQDIQMQIAVLRERIQAAQREVERALAIKDALEIGKDAFQDAQEEIEDAGGPGPHRVPIPGAPPGSYYEYTVPSLPLEMHLVPNQWWQAWVGVNAAVAQKEGLEASLLNLAARRANPQDLQAQVDQALAALAQSEAQVLAAQARVNGLQAGATAEQLAALEARVEQARAALDTLRSQKARMRLVSPLDGVVVSLAAHQGEVTMPGATLVIVADLARVQLTVYLPETQIGRVAVGQAVQVTVDSFPGRRFEGTVAHIADSAAFTPRNVATQDERANLVFAVEIGLDNADGALKPGMPADAAFQ